MLESYSFMVPAKISDADAEPQLTKIIISLSEIFNLRSLDFSFSVFRFDFMITLVSPVGIK